MYQNGPGIPGGNSGFVPPNELRLQFAVDRLNNAFRDNNIAIRFFVYAVQVVNDGLGVTMDSYTERVIYASPYTGHYDPLALNVHVVDEGGDIVEPGYDAVFVERRRFDIDENSTLTHEIGHYFGLLHTHNFSNIACLREPVSRGFKLSVCPPIFLGKRCVFTGDLLCDTPADPNMSEHGVYNGGNNCTWNGNGLQDSYGDTFNPNPNNFMAYNDGNDNCRTYFSPGQRKWMVVWAFKKKEAVIRGWLPGPNDKFDNFEPDNDAVAARLINLGETQNHTFHNKGRTDVDWVFFQYPQTGSIGSYQFEIANVTSGAVGSVTVFRRNPNGGGIEGNPIGGITSSIQGNKITFSIPSGNLVPGQNYLIRLNKGVNNSNYSIKLLGDPFIPSISGNSVLCTSNQTYSVQNLPVGTTVTWSASPSHLFAVLTGSGSSFTTRANSSSSKGAGTITAVLTNSTGTVNASKSVWVGKPASPGSITGPTSPSPTNTVAYFISNHTIAGATSYDWWLPYCYGCSIPWSMQSSVNSSQILAYVGTSDGYVQAMGVNACGYGGASILYVNPSGGGSPQMMFYPNPADDDVTVQVDNYDESKDIDIAIIDGQQRPIVQNRGKSGKPSVINTRGMRKGTYFLQVTAGEKTWTEQLIIER